MENRPQIFACVGPESSGKTTLCGQLAAHFNGALVPEFAREYLNAKDGQYEEPDLFTIAENQLKLEERIARGSDIIFCDTDTLVVMVWYQFKYRKRNKNIEALFDTQRPRKYLLTYPDLEWEPDPLRESPNDLHTIFEYYEKSLKAMGADYCTIKGKGDQRLANAIEVVSSFLRSV